jgi:hypothetical protein
VVAEIRACPRDVAASAEAGANASSYGRARGETFRGRQPTRPLLAPLAVGDELPWKLAGDGQLQWLVVIDVIGSAGYVVRNPDGATEVLVDSA